MPTPGHTKGGCVGAFPGLGALLTPGPPRVLGGGRQATDSPFPRSQELHSASHASVQKTFLASNKMRALLVYQQSKAKIKSKPRNKPTPIKTTGF